MRVIFIRHGEAESNLGDLERMVGQHADLTAEGVRGIEATAMEIGKLAIGAPVVYSSPYPRTLDSAYIIAGHLNLEVEVDDRLKEIQKGDWEGLPVWEVIEKEARESRKSGLPPYEFRPPGGENLPDVGARGAEFVEEKRLQEIDPLIAVTHNHVVMATVGTLTEQPVSEWEKLPVDFAQKTVLDYTDNRYRLRRPEN